MAFDKTKVVLARGSVNNSGTEAGLSQHTYVSADDLQAAIAAPGYFTDFLGATAEDVKLLDLIVVRDSANTFKSYRIDSFGPMTVTSVSTDANPFDQDLNTTDSPTFSNLMVTNTIDAANIDATNTITALTVSVDTGFVVQPGGVGIQLANGGSLINYYEEWSDPSFTFGASPWAQPGVVILRAERLNEKVTVRLNGLIATVTTNDFISSTDTLPVQFRPSEDSWGILQVVSAGVIAIGKVKVTTGGIIQIFSDLVNGDFVTPSTGGWSTSTITYFIQDQ